MSYAAITNIPGYLSEDDDPQRFETPREAWECLADRVETDMGDLDDFAPQAHIDALAELVTKLRLETEAGVVYGPMPGNWSEHSLGLAYCVVWAEEEATDAGA